MIAYLMENLGGLLSAVIVGITALFGVYKLGKTKGVDEARIADAEQKSEKAINEIRSVTNTVKEVQNVNQTVSGMSDADVDRRLHDKYRRPDD